LKRTKKGWFRASVVASLASVMILAPARAQESSWRANHDAGWKAYQEGRLSEADTLLRAAAKEARAFGTRDLRVALTLDHLAWVFCAEGKFTDAEPLARWALKSREELLGPVHQEVAESLNTLACLCDAQGKLADAEPCYRRCLALEEKLRGPEHPNVAALLDNLATVYHGQGKFNEAEPFYKRVLAIREKANAPADLAPTVFNLATLYLDQDRFDQAEPLYKRALTLRQQALGPDHVEVAASLDGLGWLYVSQKRLDLAEPLYKRALTIVEQPSCRDTPTAANVQEHYAALLRKLGREPEAAALEGRARAIRTNQGRATASR
jgi:tetratricopeptide (TPR) repeat protein